MKDFVIFSMFIYITKHKKTTAKILAKQFEISTRSVYRYIDCLSLAGVPIVTKLGRGGGIELIGDFYLNSFLLTEKEIQLLKNFLTTVKNEQIANILKKLVY